MLWVLKRTVSMRQLFWAPKTYAKIYGYENIYNFTLILFCLSKPMYIYRLLSSGAVRGIAI